MYIVIVFKFFREPECLLGMLSIQGNCILGYHCQFGRLDLRFVFGQGFTDVFQPAWLGVKGSALPATKKPGTSRATTTRDRAVPVVIPPLLVLTIPVRPAPRSLSNDAINHQDMVEFALDDLAGFSRNM